MMKVMLVLSDYIHAYEAAHHHRIVSERVRELRDKLAERTERSQANEAVVAMGAASREAVNPMGAALRALPGGNGGRQNVTRESADRQERSRLTPLRNEKAV